MPVLIRFARGKTFRLCQTCGGLLWPFQQAAFIACGPNTENAYHATWSNRRPEGCNGDRYRPKDCVKQEVQWAAEVAQQREGSRA